jgi:hypothetical protein
MATLCGMFVRNIEDKVSERIRILQGDIMDEYLIFNQHKYFNNPCPVKFHSINSSSR